MSRLHRLRSTRDFQRLRAEGRSGRSDGIVAQVGPHDGPTRLGVTVGRRTGTAVVRNRLRRRLRATYLARGPHEGFDVVLVARKESCSLSYQELETHVVRAMERAGVR
jgi:ribonuclease P protein component